MRNLKHKSCTFGLRIYVFGDQANETNVVLNAIIINTAVIDWQVVASRVSGLARGSGSNCCILRRNNRVYERSNKRNRQSSRSNGRAAAAYSSTLNFLLSHTKKSFP